MAIDRKLLNPTPRLTQTGQVPQPSQTKHETRPYEGDVGPADAEKPHHHNVGFIITMPTPRMYLAQCADGDQLYYVYEGMLPFCPYCHSAMRILSEYKK